MLRFDGYYKSRPEPFEDSVSGFTSKGFFHNAYLFLENGTYLRAVKKLESKYSEFVRSDFKDEFACPYHKHTKTVELVFEANKEWEFKERLSFTNSSQLSNDNLSINFCPW